MVLKDIDVLMVVSFGLVDVVLVLEISFEKLVILN